MADFPLYTFDPRSSRYRSKRTGRFVPPTAVRRAIDFALENEARKVRALADLLRTGVIDVEAWELGMKDAIRSTQLLASAAGRGGFAQMDARAFGTVGQRVRVQNEFLTKRVQQIRDGLPLDGRFLASAELYAKAGRPAFYEAESETRAAAGDQESRNILHPADHCEGPGSCLEQTDLGWQPIGVVTPPGSRLCGPNCRCTIEYRKAA